MYLLKRVINLSVLLLTILSFSQGQEIIHSDDECALPSGCKASSDKDQHLDLGQNSALAYTISKDADTTNENQHRMTLVLEQMYCDPGKASSMSIKILQGDTKQQMHLWCTKVEFRGSDFSNTKFVAETNGTFIIERIGDWEGVTASLTVSVFRETYAKCLEEEFYCGDKNKMARCISKSLDCNGRANCGGMSYNEDERCCGSKLYLYGYACNWYEWSYVWTAMFALIFVVLVPAITIFLVCSYRHRTSARRANAARRQRRNTAVREIINDHPPTYADLQETESPPCFCSAVKLPMTAEGEQNAGRINCNCQRSNEP